MPNLSLPRSPPSLAAPFDKRMMVGTLRDYIISLETLHRECESWKFGSHFQSSSFILLQCRVFLSFLLIKEKSHAAMDMGSVSPRNYTASSIYLLSGPIIKVRPFKKQSFQAFSLLNIS